MKRFLSALIIISVFSGCLKGDSGTTCNYNECAAVAPATEIQAVQTYLSNNSIAATQHCSGLFYAIDQPGSGTKPTVCNGVVFHYEGRLTDGTVFQTTQGGSPVAFNLSGLITGFKNGIPLIGAGGKIRLYIPPSLGYGNQSQPSIPANSILIFTVELVAVQ